MLLLAATEEPPGTCRASVKIIYQETLHLVGCNLELNGCQIFYEKSIPCHFLSYFMLVTIIEELKKTYYAGIT